MNSNPRIELSLTPAQVLALHMSSLGIARCRTINCDGWTSSEYCAACEEELSGEYVSARALVKEELRRVWERTPGWVLWLAFWAAAWAVALT